MNKKVKSQNGFTLVELAIGMVIIGLLIGGVLKGQELFANAQVTRTVAFVKETRTAIATFQNAYNALPGDMPNATAVLPGCNAGNFCQNGNGNGSVGYVLGQDDTTWLTKLSMTACNPNPTQLCEAEGFQFWKHLALSDIMVGVRSNADPAAPEWGISHPAAPFGGGFEMYYDGFMVTGAGGVTTSSGHILRMSTTGILPGLAVKNGGIKPSYAGRIDRKMDNGMPNSGDVIANYGTQVDNCKTSAPEAYSENFQDPACVLYFRLF